MPPKRMPTRVEVQGQLKAVMAALGKFPDGAAVDDVLSELDLGIGSLELRRRLKRLHSEGQVEITGRGRGTRYRASTASEEPEDRPGPHLSIAGLEVRRLVQRPEEAKKRVGYHWEFLEDYQPNTTFYLSPVDREKLREIGRTPAEGMLGGTYAKEILNRLLIDLAWNSSRLEGNTYSQLDTKHLIERGEEADGKSKADAQMILNHKRAIEFLVESGGEIGFNRHTILSLHGLLSENLLDDRNYEGRLRNRIVGIGGSVYDPPAVPQKVEEGFGMVLAKAGAIEDPFEQSLFVMVHLPYLQPFDDVNKRVSRLAANIPFLRLNLSPLSFTGVEKDEYVKALLGVYELNRVELVRDVYLWAYERSAVRYGSVRQALGEPDPFRLRYQQEIRALVADVVRGRRNQKEAAEQVAQEALRLPEADRERFIETTENEILALHEGNFVRYRIRPSEYEEWLEVWSRR